MLAAKCILSLIRPQTVRFLAQPSNNHLRRNIAGYFIQNKNYSSLISSPPPKKRITRLKLPEGHRPDNVFNVLAYATAEEYDLERLVNGIIKQELYEPKKFLSSDDTGVDPDVLYVSAKYQVGGKEPRDIFFFREGTCVLWNANELESSNVLKFLKEFESKGYAQSVIQNESESMCYDYDDSVTTLARTRRETFHLTTAEENYLEKYTFSNAMALSVKLGVWENALERYIDSVAYITEDLRNGKKIQMSRADMLRKTGELFELRRLINLSSNLLDTPDFYWDRENLEQVYAQACRYFNIQTRTKVMNEKLNHCVELADLISSNLNDIHHIRLEWMIIILIMVEVVFEFMHYMGRRQDAEEKEVEQQQQKSGQLVN